MWATGTGSDVMKRIAAPVIGGLVTSFLLELVVYPALYEIWRWDFDLKWRQSDWHQAGGNTEALAEADIVAASE
jgi:Cu(I)/Ag(I) efflux system membrane protein CusA/SilA